MKVKIYDNFSKDTTGNLDPFVPKKSFVERNRDLNMQLLLFFSAGISLYFLCSYVERVFNALTNGTLHTGLPTYVYFDFLSDFRLKIAIIFFFISLFLIFALGLPIPTI